MVDMNTTGERLRKLREAAGENQDEAARAAGVKKQAISKIELDHTVDPGARTLNRLAKHYGVSIDYLLDGAESAISPQSETMRLVAERVSNTAGTLLKHYKHKGFTFDLRTDRDAERFVLVYQEIAELPSEPTNDDLIAFGSKLEAIAPLSEDRGDGRAASVQVGRKASRGVGKGRS